MHPSDDAASEEEAAQVRDLAQYFVGIIYAVEGRDELDTAEIDRIQSAHLANIRRLADEGKLLLAGPFGHDGDMRGLFFFDVPTMEEAEALVASDPAVQAGRLRVDLYPWWATSKLKHLPG